MHILFLPSSYPSEISQIQGSFVKDQVIALKKAGHKIGVVYPELASIRKLSFYSLRKNHFQSQFSVEDEVNVARFLGWSIPKLTQLNLWFFRRSAHILLKKYVSKFGVPDLIHAHGFRWAGIAAASLKEKFNIPVVVTEHSSAFSRGLISDWEKKAILKSAKVIDHIIAVSQTLANSILELDDSLDISVVPNVVDTEFFSLPPLDNSRKAFRFLNVALLSKNKGLDVLLRAFNRAFDNESEVLLEICGDGIERNELESLSRELGISGKVKFRGMLDRTRIREAMWESNALVSSSYVETFGVVLIEAMSTGLPVISTKSGGPNDIVPTTLQGCLVEPGNEDELATALAHYVQKREDLIDKRDALRQYAIRQFGTNALQNSLNLIYSRIIG